MNIHERILDPIDKALAENEGLPPSRTVEKDCLADLEHFLGRAVMHGNVLIEDAVDFLGAYEDNLHQAKPHVVLDEKQPTLFSTIYPQSYAHGET